ncbi:MAG: ion transporter [Deltaproteobacteria bacterium]|nr:ion transporter [Deltaproteobacteria bacterium]
MPEIIGMHTSENSLWKTIATSKLFESSIIALIILNAVMMALETSPAVMEHAGDFLHIANWVIQTIFIVEIGIRLLSYQPKVGRFFRDGWNLYDFTIVALSTLPLTGAFINVARLARVLRITRLISYSPELKLIVSAMLKSIPSMGHVIVLLLLLLYVYAVIGFHFFSAIDPQNWGSLMQAFLTLFQVLTLENWPDIQSAVAENTPLTYLYFMSFIVVAVFVIMNLFIAVVINNLEAVKSEELIKAAEQHSKEEISGVIEQIHQKLDELEALIKISKS